MTPSELAHPHRPAETIRRSAARTARCRGWRRTTAGTRPEWSRNGSTSSRRDRREHQHAEPDGRPADGDAASSAIDAIAIARSTDGSHRVMVPKHDQERRSRPRRPDLATRARRSSGANSASTNATFSPDTASRCVSPAARNCSVSPGGTPRVSPSRNPARSARSTGCRGVDPARTRPRRPLATRSSGERARVTPRRSIACDLRDRVRPPPTHVEARRARLRQPSQHDRSPADRAADGQRRRPTRSRARRSTTGTTTVDRHARRDERRGRRSVRPRDRRPTWRPTTPRSCCATACASGDAHQTVRARAASQRPEQRDRDHGDQCARGPTHGGRRHREPERHRRAARTAASCRTHRFAGQDPADRTRRPPPAAQPATQAPASPQSDGDERRELREALVADAAHAAQVVDRLEPAAPLAARR